MAKSPTVRQLRAECKARGLKRYSKLKKADLLALLAQQQPF
jgi:hypothetical protein